MASIVSLLLNNSVLMRLGVFFLLFDTSNLSMAQRLYVLIACYSYYD